MIQRHFPAILAKLIERPMRTFALSTRKRIKNELLIKKRIEDSVDRMMQKTVTDSCFVNVSWFRVIDAKRVIRSVPIGSFFQFMMKRQNIISQTKRKLLDIPAPALPAQKFSPRNKQIIDRNDIVVDMARPDTTLSLSLENASILNRIKEGYLLWLSIAPHIQKGARYTIGSRIENKFLDLLELSYIAYFTEKEKKLEKVARCILTLDTLKFLISVAWEGKLISNKQCEDVALKLEEVGRMFGGWKKSLDNPDKKNRTL
jgi:hypothetical protein